jgi:hypothetical protein
MPTERLKIGTVLSRGHYSVTIRLSLAMYNWLLRNAPKPAHATYCLAGFVTQAVSRAIPRAKNVERTVSFMVLDTSLPVNSIRYKRMAAFITIDKSIFSLNLPLLGLRSRSPYKQVLPIDQ